MENVENGVQPQLSKRAQIANPFRAMVFGAMADEMIANGTDVVKLSLGEPDFGAPPAVRDAMREQYDGRPLPYTAAMGLPELRQAISDFYKERHHVDVDPKRIAITAGGSTALLLSAALTVVLMTTKCSSQTRPTRATASWYARSAAKSWTCRRPPPPDST